MSTLFPLAGNQRRAVDPQESVWLSASAGTGKTQVLTARVLRLLLVDHVRPEQILCLTFTKAGATEMAARINETLARWVRADAAHLAKELGYIGADITPELQARARTLFAQVLDCPSGGLRIDTIHAFSQWLLAAFPEEAGLTAGARPMEDHEKALLSRSVLAELLTDAEAQGRIEWLNALEHLALRLGEDKALAFLSRCAAAGALWLGGDGVSNWRLGPLAARVRALLGLPENADAAWLAAMCDDAHFDTISLRAAMAITQQWKTKTGVDNANRIGDWLAADAAGRLQRLDDLAEVFLKQNGLPRASASLDKIDPAYPDYAARVISRIVALREARSLLALAEWLAPALELGRAYALAWDAAKARAGLIDFDDQIARAAELLARSDMADWIRYKFDRRFDHILVDEAQDTNVAQWGIIEALTEDFYVGEGAKGGRRRTLFVVGDYKQAIFGFQGTSPENFNAARERLAARMKGAAANAASLRGGPDARELVDLGLGRSYRTAASVLQFVDRAIAHIGAPAFGLSELPVHEGQPRPGQVVLWRPVGMADNSEESEAEDGGGDDAAAGDGGTSGDGEEDAPTFSKPERQLADRIARQIKHWVTSSDGFPLVKDKDKRRRAHEGDIMVLVRKRRELAGLIVARLHAAGVKVAGVDRLRLGAPLAVRDLLTALRFAAQPLDDLNLACLLVSPLIGWSQEQLLAHGYRERSTGLWAHLRASTDPEVAVARDKLGQLLARADYDSVPVLLHWLLVGPWAARRALVSRLGRDANDPIDELINATHAFAATATPSLVGFLAWFEAGDAGGDIKREAGKTGDQVRVMTVHGAKGLQAPIVILADATGDPEKGMAAPAALPLNTASDASGPSPRVPLPDLAKSEMLGPIADAMAAAKITEAQEHWRLLYVAMTRAEEALFVTGALGAQEPVPAAGSWYAKLAECWPKDAWVADPIWVERLEDGEAPRVPYWPPETRDLGIEVPPPNWARRSAPEEARPARPLVPSALGEDDSAAPPAMMVPLAPGISPGGVSEAALAAAARRGTLIHGLLERLPHVPPALRAEAAARWLSCQAGDLDTAARAAMADAALAVIADPRWAELFDADAAQGQLLAEAPIAALVGGRVITGTIDRLLIAPDRIRLVDYKTTRRPPASADAVPVPMLRQMAAYVAALEASFPGRPAQAALLFTEGPRLIELPPALLAAHKPDYHA